MSVPRRADDILGRLREGVGEHGDGKGREVHTPWAGSHAAGDDEYDKQGNTNTQTMGFHGAPRLLYGSPGQVKNIYL
jgi:hypothetical protein